jgi:transposase-like protein
LHPVRQVSKLLLQDLQGELKGAHLLPTRQRNSFNNSSQRVTFENEAEAANDSTNRLDNMASPTSGDDKLPGIKLPALNGPESKAASPAGHGIITRRDRSKHDQFLSTVSDSQPLPPEVRQKAIAASFQGRHGIQQTAVTVEAQDNHRRRRSKKAQAQGSTPKKTVPPTQPESAPATQEARLVDNYYALEVGK